MEKELINTFLSNIYNSMTDKKLYIQVASEKLHELMKKQLINKLNNLDNMRQLLENELKLRRKFGCNIDDILDDIAEILEQVKEKEYNKGYVDCAKTYQFNKMREPREIWRVLDEINKQVDSAENYFSSAVVKFKGDLNFINYIKDTNTLAVKINPIKDESLKLTFDWGQLIVEIYYIEEH